MFESEAPGTSVGRSPLVAAASGAVVVAGGAGVASGAEVVRGVIPTGNSVRCGTTAGTAETSGDRAARDRWTTGTADSASAAWCARERSPGAPCDGCPAGGWTSVPVSGVEAPVKGLVADVSVRSPGAADVAVARRCPGRSVGACGEPGAGTEVAEGRGVPDGEGGAAEGRVDGGLGVVPADGASEREPAGCASPGRASPGRRAAAGELPERDAAARRTAGPDGAAPAAESLGGDAAARSVAELNGAVPADVASDRPSPEGGAVGAAVARWGAGSAGAVPEVEVVPGPEAVERRAGEAEGAGPVVGVVGR